MASYTYEPFGGAAVNGEDFGNPFQFRGRDNEGFAGLYYYRALYYHPGLARFISENPIGFAGVKPGATIEVSFDVPRNCHYSVRLEMDSGHVREANVGYVTRGLTFQDRIVITPDGVTLSEPQEIR